MCSLISRKSRKTVDTTETMKQFGPVEIHYGKVQQKVNLKYDSWHREILSRFGSMLGDNMLDFHSTVAKASLLILPNIVVCTVVGHNTLVKAAQLWNKSRSLYLETKSLYLYIYKALRGSAYRFCSGLVLYICVTIRSIRIPCSYFHP